MRGLWWWIDRWRKSTAYTDLTLAEQGAYRNLLDEATLRGGTLPNDDRILGKACGDALAWRKVKAAVLARFTLGPDNQWRHETLTEVLLQSSRRAQNQASWRSKADNAPDNAAYLGTDNATYNATDNTGGLTGGLRADNKPDYPDPDPYKKEKKEQQRLPPRPQSNGRLTLFRWQIATLLERLGDHAQAFDLDAWLWNDLSQRSRPVFRQKGDMWTWVQREFEAEVTKRQLPTLDAGRADDTTRLQEMAAFEAELKARGK